MGRTLALSQKATIGGAQFESVSPQYADIIRSGAYTRLAEGESLMAPDPQWHRQCRPRHSH
jgi:hypothetical protein